MSKWGLAAPGRFTGVTLVPREWGAAAEMLAGRGDAESSAANASAGKITKNASYCALEQIAGFADPFVFA